ncbi:hypothetical protein U1Q18_037441 [Sarracenia purpurea var. burkii]
MNGLDASCNLGCVGGSSPKHVLQGMERENLEVAELVSQVDETRCGFSPLVQEVGHHVEGMGLGGGSGVPCAGEAFCPNCYFVGLFAVPVRFSRVLLFSGCSHFSVPLVMKLVVIGGRF